MRIDMASLATPQPSVQEMLRHNPSEIPEKFLVSDTSCRDLSDSEIPVIDFSLLSTGNKEELHKLDLACKEWGYIQLVNHGVAREVLQGMKEGSAKFFELPLEEKNKISISFSKDKRQGYGQPFVPPEDRTVDWNDALVLDVYPSHIKDLDSWPTEPKGIQEVIEAFGSEVNRVTEEVLRSLSLTMGLEKDVLLGLHGELSIKLRVNYVPPCPKPDKVLGVLEHTDGTSITVLMQDDDVSGFQIRKRGEWVSVNPIRDALVVLVGDALEMWSNGKYKSILHRGLTNSSKARISHVAFVFPHLDVDIEPFEHLVESSGTSLQVYKKIKYRDYLVQSLKTKMEAKERRQAAAK